MKPIALRIALLGGCMLSAFTGWGHDFMSSSGIYYKITNQDKAYVGVTFKGDNYNSYSDEYSGIIEIPNWVMYNGTKYTVTSIELDAFRDCNSITTVCIPETVLDVYSPFLGCTGLTTIEFLDPVGGGTSYNYTKFHTQRTYSPAPDEDGDIRQNVTNIPILRDSNIQRIYIGHPFICYMGKDYWNSQSEDGGWNVMDVPGGFVPSGKKISSVEYGEKLNLGTPGECFPDNSIENLYIPSFQLWVNVQDHEIYTSEIKRIESGYGYNDVSYMNSLMAKCENLYVNGIETSEISLGNSIGNITKLGKYTFTGAKCISSVTLPNDFVSFGYYTFFNCVNLKNVYNLSSLTIEKGSNYNGYVGCYANYISYPDEVIIGDFQFRKISNRYNLLSYLGIETSITLPDNADNETYEIGMYAFYRTQLEQINIPVGVTKLGEYAFYKCSELSKIKLSESIEQIGNYAFYNCDNLSQIRMDVEDPSMITTSSYAFNLSDYSSCRLLVPGNSISLYQTISPWNKFTRTEPWSHNLIDGQAYNNNTDYSDIDITYTRTFNNTNWQPLYLPFSMDYDEWSSYADIAELYNVRGYDKDEDGEIDDVYIEFNRLKRGSTKPNVPYVVKAKQTGKVTFTCPNKTLTAAPFEEGTVECSSTKFTYTMHGIYEPKTDVYATGAYIMAGGNFGLAKNESVTLSPYRFYLTITPKNGGYNDDTSQMNCAPQRIILSVDGETDTTGLEDIFISAPKNNIYYDLMGRRVKNPKNGLYILNGQKIYIK